METHFPQLGSRIAVVGCSGSGKTTLAGAIGRERCLAYVNFDELLWKPNWVQRSEAEFHGLIEQHLAGDDWVFDGNIGGREHLVLPRIDTLIWLDYPRHVVMRRLLRRTIRRAWKKETLFAGNRETWRMSFASRESILLYAWQSHGRLREAYTALFNDLPGHITPIRLKAPAQADRLLRVINVSGA